MEEQLKACGHFHGASASARSSMDTGLTPDQQASGCSFKADFQKDFTPQDHSSGEECIPENRGLRGNIAHALGQLSQADGPPHTSHLCSRKWPETAGID